MAVNNLKVTLLPHTPFLKDNGKFDLKKAMSYQGQIGGICYSEEGLVASFNEDNEKTEKRINMTTSGEHQSVFEHVNVGLYLKNSPKFLNMILNNEHQYSASERSLRYTKIKDDGTLPKEMVGIYNKWCNIFFEKIKDKYGSFKSDNAIMKLANENARYLMPVTIPTEMVYTVPLAQLNRIVQYLMDYEENGINGKKDDLHREMSPYIQEFIYALLYDVEVLDERLISNRKHRNLSIFGTDLKNVKPEYGEVYSTVYKGSFAELAQAQRHRTIYYQMERELKYTEYFVPPIIEDDYLLINEWQEDLSMLARKYDCIPQGEKVYISEKGTLDTFVMKMKERLCSSAQLEIAMQTRLIRDEYYENLKDNKYLLQKMEPYMKGARCTFKDYDCPKDCKFNEGKLLIRKI